MVDRFIIVKLVNGSKHKLCISKEYHTVSLLKSQIEDLFYFKKGSQRLSYKGSPLLNEFNLLNLPNKSIIHLVLQLETIDEN